MADKQKIFFEIFCAIWIHILYGLANTIHKINKCYCIQIQILRAQAVFTFIFIIMEKIAMHFLSL